MLQPILSVLMGSHETFGVVIDNFRYQLDSKRRFVSKSISTCILGTVVVIKSMKYDGYTYSQVTIFSISIRYQTAICVKIDIDVYIRNNCCHKIYEI